MPKETFNNLPEDKKNSIIQVAIDEFFEYGYELASISRIVKLAGIAKGSFYQYFEGKEDLFKYIITIASEKKLKYLNDIIADSDNINFFELLKGIFMGSLNFQKENLKLASVIDRFLKSANYDIKEMIMGNSVKNSNLFLEKLLRNDIARKEMRPDLNISFTAHMITGIAVSLSDYMRDSFDDIEKLDESLYEKLVNETIKILKEGIQNNNK
jgi:AcrR family transcriptional regulator